MLADAAARAVKADIAAFMLVVDARTIKPSRSIAATASARSPASLAPYFSRWRLPEN